MLSKMFILGVELPEASENHNPSESIPISCY
jgi:hypothetical protein